jgi:hypothetical protein
MRLRARRGGGELLCGLEAWCFVDAVDRGFRGA